jgi:hypothetical protein
MNAPTRPAAWSAAHRFADRWQDLYPKAVACLRAGLDDLLTCFRYRTLEERKAVRTTDEIERCTRSPSAGSFWALLASGQITLRRVDGWQTLERSRSPTLTSPPDPPHHARSVPAPPNLHQPRDTTRPERPTLRHTTPIWRSKAPCAPRLPPR